MAVAIQSTAIALDPSIRVFAYGPLSKQFDQRRNNSYLAHSNGNASDQPVFKFQQIHFGGLFGQVNAVCSKHCFGQHCRLTVGYLRIPSHKNSASPPTY